MAKRIKSIIIVLLGMAFILKFALDSKDIGQIDFGGIELGGIMTYLYFSRGTVLEVDYDTGILLVELETDYEKIAYLDEEGYSDLNDKFFNKKEVVLECPKNKISENHVKDGDKVFFSLFLWNITEEDVPVPIQEISLEPL